MSNINIKTKDVVWVYLSRFLPISVNILLLPLIMRFLSEEELGLWYVFASISQIVNLFDFGFNVTISRHMTYAWSGAEKLQKSSISEKYGEEINCELVSEIMATCRLVYFIISAGALLVMLTVGTAYINAVTENGLTKNILSAWIVYSISIFINMFYGYLSSLLQGVGAVAERSKIMVISKITQILLASILIPCGLGLFGFVVSYFLGGIALRITGKIYLNKKTKDIILSRRVGISRIKKCFRNIWGTAWKDGVVMLSQYFSTQANTLICAYYIDLASTSVYGVMTQIVSVISSMASTYFSAYQPTYCSYCLKRDLEGQKRIACAADFIYKVIFFVGFILLISLGIPIIKVIRPNMSISVEFLILLCLFYYFFTQKDLFSSMIASENELLYWRSYVLTAVASLLLSFIFVGQLKLGIIGLVLAPLIVNAAYNAWRWPLYLMKKVNIKYSDIYIIGFQCIKQEVKRVMNRQSTL